MKTILSKKDILDLIQQKKPLVEEYIKLEDQLQPNGFDLTLKEIAKINSRGCLGVSNEQRVLSTLSPLAFDTADNVELMAGAYVITFNEIINLPKNVMAMGAPRSSLLRCGVTVHMAVWDAGYCGRGQSLMVVYNSMGFKIQHNARIAQLVFTQLVDETEAYNGSYQGENIK